MLVQFRDRRHVVDPTPKVVSMSSSSPVFVVPVHLDDSSDPEHLRACCRSLINQTDPNWNVVFVNDDSTATGHRQLGAAVRMIGARATILHTAERSGPGVARNIGVAWASRKNSPFVMFQDADDVADANRLLSARQLFMDRGADFVYSRFRTIDEDGRTIPAAKLSPSIREIVDAHANPPVGPTAWREVALETGYATLTSTVSVRTSLAAQLPFPEIYASEDQHTWLRMMASTDKVFFDSLTVPAYRVSTDGSGSAARRRIGDRFYVIAAFADVDGFVGACKIALARRTIVESELPQLVGRFLRRTAESLRAEAIHDEANRYVRLAAAVESSNGKRALDLALAQGAIHE